MEPRKRSKGAGKAEIAVLALVGTFVLFAASQSVGELEPFDLEVPATGLFAGEDMYDNLTENELRELYPDAEVEVERRNGSRVARVEYTTRSTVAAGRTGEVENVEAENFNVSTAGTRINVSSETTVTGVEANVSFLNTKDLDRSYIAVSPGTTVSEGERMFRVENFTRSWRNGTGRLGSLKNEIERAGGSTDIEGLSGVPRKAVIYSLDHPAGEWRTLQVSGQDPSVMVLDPATVTWEKPDWDYRRPINVSHTADRVDFQLNISMDTTTLYNNNKLQVDCDDIRFTWLNQTSNLEQQIPFWFEECNTAGSNSTFWYQVPEISSSRDEVVYVYYDNPDAANAENFDKTFTKNPDAPSDTGLLAEYHMDNSSSDVLSDDAPGFSLNNANLTNASYTGSDGGLWDSRSIGFSTGDAVLFSGNDSYAKAGNSSGLNVDDELTIEAWFRMRETPTEDGNTKTIVDKEDSGGGYSLKVVTNGTQNQLNFTVKGETLLGLLESGGQAGSNLNDDGWNHVMAVYNTTHLKVVVNGNISEESEFSDTVADSSDNLYIGATNGDSEFFNGTIDEVRIYNRSFDRGGVRAHWKRSKEDNPFPSKQLLGEEEVVEKNTTVEEILSTQKDRYSAGEVVNLSDFDTFTIPSPGGRSYSSSQQTLEIDESHQLHYDQDNFTLPDSDASSDSTITSSMGDSDDGTTTKMFYDPAASPAIKLVTATLDRRPREFNEIIFRFRVSDQSGPGPGGGDFTFHGWQYSTEDRVNRSDRVGATYNIGDSFQWRTLNMTPLMESPSFDSTKTRFAIVNETSVEYDVSELEYEVRLDHEAPDWEEMTQSGVDFRKNEEADFNVRWTDGKGILSADLEFNTSDGWETVSKTFETGEEGWTNFTVNTSRFESGTIGWRVNASDYRGNWNVTRQESFTVGNSQIRNTGDSDLRGFLVLDLQFFNATTGKYEHVRTFHNDTAEGRQQDIPPGDSLLLADFWSGFNTSGEPIGEYRSRAYLTDGSGSILEDADGEKIYETSKFQIELLENLTIDPNRTGFGRNVTFEVESLDPDSTESVDYTVTRPDGQDFSDSMVKIGPDSYQANFSETWRRGVYDVEVEAKTGSGGRATLTDTFSIKPDIRLTQGLYNQSYPRNRDANLVEKGVFTGRIVPMPSNPVTFVERRPNVSQSINWGSTTLTQPDSDGTVTDTTGTLNDSDDSTFNELIHDDTGELQGTTSKVFESDSAYSKINYRVRMRTESGDTSTYDFRLYAYKEDDDSVYTGDVTKRLVSVTGTFQWYSFNVTLPVKESPQLNMRLRMLTTNATDAIGSVAGGRPQIAEVRYNLTEENDAPDKEVFSESSRSPQQGDSVRVFSRWTDNVNLGFAWISTNVSGNFTNESYVQMAGKRDWGNFTLDTSGLRGGQLVHYRVWANDSTNGNVNITVDRSFRVSRSILVNRNGSYQSRYYLKMFVQTNESGSWSTNNVDDPIVVDDTSSVVGAGDGARTVSEGELVNLAEIFNPNGWDTGSNDPQFYRVRTEVVDPEGAVLTNSTAELVSNFVFKIIPPELNLEKLNHENLAKFGIREYGSGDNLAFANASIKVENSSAEDVNMTMQVENPKGKIVDWGPNETKECGDLAKGETCGKEWNNSGAGYDIPAGEQTGVYEFDRDAIIETSDGDIVFKNVTFEFDIYNQRDFLDATLNPDRVIQNESSVYNLTVENPWNGTYTDVNVTLNYNTSAYLNVTCLSSGSGAMCDLGNISSEGEDYAAFNVTTNVSTPVSNYDLNSTVRYVNPGLESKTVVEASNRVLRVRQGGLLVKFEKTPGRITRDEPGKEFKGTINNTQDSTQFNLNSTWIPPANWENTTGKQTKLKDNITADEIVFHNVTFRPGIDADLGEQKVRLRAETDTTFDSNFVRVTVYADTSVSTSLDNLDPVRGGQVNIDTDLAYDNGTAVKDAEVNLTDETSGEFIDEAFTDSNGDATLTYNIPDNASLGTHVLNTTHPGSDEFFTNPSFVTDTITVHDRPVFHNFTVQPDSVGFNRTVTVEVNVTDSFDGIDWVQAEFSGPENVKKNMTNLSQQHLFAVNFSSWENGNFTVDVKAVDSAGKVNTTSGSFVVEVDSQVMASPEKDSYQPDTFVNLTETPRKFTDDPAESFQRDLNEGSVTITNDEFSVYDDPDSDAVQSADVTDKLTDNDNSTTIKLDRSSGSDEAEALVVDNPSSPDRYSEILLRTVLDNNNGATEDITLFAYRNDGDRVSHDLSKFVEESQTTGMSFYTYNVTEIVKNSTHFDTKLRYVYNDTGYDIDVAEADLLLRNETQPPKFYRYGESDLNPDRGEDVEVRAYWTDNHRMETAKLVYNLSGTMKEKTFSPSSNETWTNHTIDTSGLDFGDRVTYHFRMEDQVGNYNQTGNRSFVVQKSEVLSEGNSFSGYLHLVVQSNSTGTWETVDVKLNDTETDTRRNFSDLSFDVSQFWNDDPFYTGTRDGFYRPYAYVTDPNGTVLADSSGDLAGGHPFKIQDADDSMKINELRVYEVTGESSKKTDTSELVASGTNRTFTLYVNRSYRFEAELENTGSSTFWINQSNVTHRDLNASWDVDENDNIFYLTSQEFTGGNFSNRDIEWNTSKGGTVDPGNLVNFKYVFNTTRNTAGDYQVRFVLNATDQVKDDYSTFNVEKFDDTEPQVVAGTYDVPDSLDRGESGLAHAKWDKDLDTGKAEYNTTTSTLQNHTATIGDRWSNRTLSTNSSWDRGVHQFRFYITDAFGIQARTEQRNFTVYGLASLVSQDIESPILQGEDSTVECGVESDRGTGIGSYNVTFRTDEKGVLGFNQTNSTGIAVFTFSDSTLGDENVSCEIDPDVERFFHVGDGLISGTLTTREDIPPNYTEFSQSDENITKLREMSFNATWQDNFRLENATIATNETGTMQNSTFQDMIALEGTEDFSSFSKVLSEDFTLGPIKWRIWANDTFGNYNATPVRTFTVLGYAEINSSALDPDRITVNSTTEFSCRVRDVDNLEVIGSYNVSFYNSTSLLGHNQSDGDGWAYWHYTDNTTGTEDLECQIGNDFDEFYYASNNNKSTETLETVQPGEDVMPPYLVDGFYGISETLLRRGKSLKAFAQWNESIGNATAIIDRGGDKDIQFVETITSPSNFTNTTITTDTSYNIGTNSVKLNATDELGNENDTLKFLDFKVWAWSETVYREPTGKTPRAENTRFECDVRDNKTLESISDYTVEFRGPDFSDVIGTNTTNSTGTATLFVDTTQFSTGDKSFFCAIGDSENYNASDDGFRDSGSVTLVGELFTNITAPGNGTVIRRDENVTLESRTVTDNGSYIVPRQANWFNETSLVAEAVNTSYVIPSQRDVGIFNLSIETSDPDFVNGTDYRLLEMWGYANVSILEPESGESFAQGTNVTLTCQVNDNATFQGVAGYNTTFFVENSTDRFTVGENTTVTGGNATEVWNTDGYAAGEYHPGCNIGDEPELFYNASSNSEDNTTVQLNAANGILDGNLTEPLNLTSVAQNRTFTANVSVTCRNDDCGDVTTTLRYNASGAKADTAVSETSDQPFYTIGSNPRSCGTLNQGDSCFTSWEVNATGTLGSEWSLDSQLEGTTAQTNDTVDKKVGIEIVLIFNLNYSLIDFPSGAPSRSSPNFVEAPGNSGDKYFAELDEDSNDATGGVWIKGTQLNHTGGSGPDYRRIPPENTTYTLKPSCSYAGSDKIHEDYTQVLDFLDSGDNFTNCFFQEIPQGKAAGIYDGNITIKVNTTN